MSPRDSAPPYTPVLFDHLQGDRTLADTGRITEEISFDEAKEAEGDVAVNTEHTSSAAPPAQRHTRTLVLLSVGLGVLAVLYALMG